MHGTPTDPMACHIAHLHDASWCAPRAERLAKSVGLSERDAAEVAIIVSELVTNAVKYGGGGELTVRSLSQGESGIEVIVTDGGPGIGDMEAVFHDGYSHGAQREPGAPLHGSLGVGLGAVRRLSDKVELSNRRPHGLMVRVVKYLR